MIDTSNYPKMVVYVDPSHANLGDREAVESAVKAALEAGTQFEGQPDLMASPTDGIHMTGWFKRLGRYTTQPLVSVELYMEPSADGDIPSAVTYFKRNGFDADYPGSLNPDTGHCWSYCTSVWK